MNALNILPNSEFGSVTILKFEDSLKKAIDKYDEVVESLTGLRAEYHDAKTPFLEESTKDCPYRAPCDMAAKEFIECPSCRHTFSSEFAQEHCTHEAGTQRTVKTFKAQEEEYAKYIAKGSPSGDKIENANDDIDDAATAVPSDTELSDWEDSDDD